jgi:two-component system, NarL family, invasion response regulator UvrY
MAFAHPPKRLLIADDHRIVREGLKQLLADAPDLTVVGEAQDGDDTVARVEALVGEGLDAVLLDIALPGRDGLDVLQAIKARWPQLPVLMLSTYPERHYAARCLSLGAAGYLNKSADADVIISAARRVASGGVYVTEAGGQALAAALHGGRTKAGQGAVPGSGARASAVAEHGGVDAHANEALGLCEGRRELQANRRASVLADRCQEIHGPSRIEGTGRRVPQVQGDGQRV